MIDFFTVKVGLRLSSHSPRIRPAMSLHDYHDVIHAADHQNRELEERERRNEAIKSLGGYSC